MLARARRCIARNNDRRHTAALHFDLERAIFKAKVPEDLTSIEKLVLLCLVHHADNFEGTCFPSVECITAETGICDRSVRLALRSLDEEHKGWIATTFRSKDHLSSIYKITPPEGAT